MPITPQKSRPKSCKARGTRPGRNGGRLNAGGTFTGAGRPPDEFKRRMAAIASSEEALAYLEACVKGEHGPQAALAGMRYAAERGYGQPTRQHDVTHREVVARLPEPVTSLEEWERLYQPMLHKGHGPSF